MLKNDYAMTYTNYAHIDEDDKLTSQIAIAGQRRDVTVINKSRLYALVFGSRLETANQF